MPIRKIPKNYRNVTGVAASDKAVGDAQFESTLERDFLALLEFSPEVTRFEVQPVKIEWRDGQDKPRSYTPDVLVEFDIGLSQAPWLCEVKYRNDLKKGWDDLHPKFRRGIRYAKAHGWRFRLITEVEIRTPYLDNVRFLMPFRFRQIPEADIEQVLAELRSTNRATPARLTQAFSDDKWRQAELLPAVWHLLANHQIGADLDVALTMDSHIWSQP